MKFMLDTNICIYIIKQKPWKGLNRFCYNNPGIIRSEKMSLTPKKKGGI